ncbi:glutamyl endopeptidase [Fusarium longipes]|uniref:Glutamyl endopeptidase n=1 Tax=Fusarium longipes TaxID=694270 RepID=A0A395SLG6_9HYPO|nr:glutamyl endopeptidase [Fusarium longipes]
MSTSSSKPGRAAVWSLQPPTSNHPAESTVIPDDGSKGSSESIIGEDQRALVDFSDFLEGGKYRSIVKIQARFDGKGKPVWMMGTGWLIRPDVLVTAGHVVYDWGRRYGAASQIRCFIGYNGRASLQTAQVQARYGVKVISTEGWLQDAGNRTLPLVQTSHFFSVTTNSITQDRVNGVNGRGSQPKTVTSHHSEGGEEGFLDIFKKVANVGSKLIPLASPLLGPVGGILGPAVGGLLGSLAESEFSDNPDIKADGTAERALLAEAALQAVLASEHTEGLSEVVGKMERIWRVDAPKVDYLAPVVAPMVAECGQSFLHERQRPVYATSVKTFRDQPRRSLGIDMSESALGGEEAAFVQGLMGPTRQVAGEEGMFDWLGPVLNQGLKLAKPIATKAASAALAGVGSYIKKSIGAESGAADVSPEHEEATKVLLKRAVMADTALQALMTLPSHKLEQLKPINPETGEAEGIFDFIKDTVQKLGPIALDTAKSAAKTYLPRLIDTATKKVSSRLGLPTESAGSTRTLSRKPSLMDTLNGKNTAIKVRHVSRSADGTAFIDITPIIRAREEAWEPSEEWHKCWDDNDDGPVLMTPPPPDM